MGTNKNLPLIALLVSIGGLVIGSESGALDNLIGILLQILALVLVFISVKIWKKAKANGVKSAMLVISNILCLLATANFAIKLLAILLLLLF